jgi:uncharacterized membrane protein
MKLMKQFLTLGFALAILAIGCNNPPADAETTRDAPRPTTTVSFSNVHAVLEARCVGCHSGADAKEGLDLSTYAGLMKGSEHGPVVQPGEPEESKIVQAMRGAEGHKRMPPLGDAVPEDEIQQLEAWIRGGATS